MSVCTWCLRSRVQYTRNGIFAKKKAKTVLAKKKARVKNNSFKSIILAKKIARVIFISNWKILAKKKARETVLLQKVNLKCWCVCFVSVCLWGRRDCVWHFVGSCNSGLVVFSDDGLKRANSGPLVRRCLVTKADV